MAKSKADTKKKTENVLNNPKPLQILPTNAAKAPFKGGLGKAYIAPQEKPDYFKPEEGLLKGTLFKELDDGFKIEEE